MMSPRLALLSVLFLLGGCASAAAPLPVGGLPEPSRQCRVDSDCVVKDVGNCCGYYPACVHRDSAVDPERVRAACLKKGQSSICGFAEIAACRCEKNVCSAVEPAVP